MVILRTEADRVGRWIELMLGLVDAALQQGLGEAAIYAYMSKLSSKATCADMMREYTSAHSSYGRQHWLLRGKGMLLRMQQEYIEKLRSLPNLLR